MPAPQVEVMIRVNGQRALPTWEAADYLGVSSVRVSQLVQRGVLRPVRWRGWSLFAETDLDRYSTRHRRPPARGV